MGVGLILRTIWVVGRSCRRCSPPVFAGMLRCIGSSRGPRRRDWLSSTSADCRVDGRIEVTVEGCIVRYPIGTIGSE